MWKDLVDGAPCPVEKFARAGADGVFTDGTEEPLIGLPALLEHPLHFWKGHDPDEVDEQTDHHAQQHENQMYLKYREGKYS